MYIKRERYLDEIHSFCESDIIKVISGVRRCGKSVLLSQIEAEIFAKMFQLIILSVSNLKKFSSKRSEPLKNSTVMYP